MDEFETYEDVIDAFNANDMGYSTLTDYIRGQNIKIKEIEMEPLADLQRSLFENKADGGIIGIEVLFRDKKADGGRVPMVSGGALKGLMSLFKGGDKAVDLAKQEEIFRSGPITTKFLEDVDPGVANKFIRTRDMNNPGGYGLYDSFDEMPAGLKAAELISRIRKKGGGIDYEAAEIFLGTKLKGNETVDELIDIMLTKVGTKSDFAEGGRVGLFMGGDPLTGQALQIYDSMKAYNFTDQEIADALAARGLYTPGGTTQSEQVTGIINQQLQTGGGGDGPITPPGPKFNRDDLLGESDYQGTGPGVIESILGIPAALVNAYSKISPINFVKNIFRPNVERINKINVDAAAKAEELRKAKAEAERAAFLAQKQRDEQASQLGGPDGTSGGQYAGGAAFASANPYGGSGTDDDLGADSFKEGGLATMFTRRR
jgi:hypothetical protein